MADDVVYRMTIETRCDRSDGKLMFADQLTYDNMDKSNVELIEGELIDLLKRLNEFSKANTQSKKQKQ